MADVLQVPSVMLMVIAAAAAESATQSKWQMEVPAQQKMRAEKGGIFWGQ
jgi:hypothetical protein